MSIFQWWLDGFSQKYISLYLYLGLFFENRRNSGLTPGQNDNPVTRTWKMTQMTHWPGDPMTQFHVCSKPAARLWRCRSTGQTDRLICWARILWPLRRSYSTCYMGISMKYTVLAAYRTHTAQVDWLGLRLAAIWRAVYTFIKWTGWTLAMTLDMTTAL